MKRTYLLISLVIIIIFSVNIYYYFKLYQQQVSFQKNFLMKQTQIIGYEIENTGYRFESDFNYIPFSGNLDVFFEDENIWTSVIKQFETFYLRYENLVTNILFYDNNKNVFSLFRDRTNKFITDTYTSHNQLDLVSRDTIIFKNKEYLYYLPVFENNEVIGNLVVTINYVNYIKSVFDKSYIEDIQWQWLINTNGKILYFKISPTDKIDIRDVDQIADEITRGAQNTIQHIAFKNGEKTEIISAYYPIKILRREFGIVISLESDLISKSIINNSIKTAVLTFLLISLIVGIFLFYIFKRRREWNEIKNSERSLEEIIENLPQGVIIFNKEQTIRKINKSARKLFKGDPDVREGKKMGSWFFQIQISDKNKKVGEYFLNEILVYKNEDDDIILLKKEIPLFIWGEKLFMVTLIDITVFEKAWKSEAIAVKTKSDFLANMSYEIRTPLNGIIGLTDHMVKINLTEKQKISVSNIRKSADLLLSIVDDILTFSKIEAGDMFVEEIPFQLRKELDHALKLIVLKAKEKKIDFKLIVAEDVTDRIIGDLFKIRQIVSQLSDNAVKFTSKGKVQIIVNQIENIAGKLILQFIIEDTGIGIPPENLKNIFNSFVQSDVSAARKPGGSGLGTLLSKQIVELLKGEIKAESPSGLSDEPECPGSRFIFIIDVFSDERIVKNIPRDKVIKYSDINALIIKDNDNKGQKVMEMLSNFGVNAKLNFYQEKTINLIQSNLQSDNDHYNLLLLRDSDTFDAFQFAQSLYNKQLIDKFLVIITSANDKKGNYVKSRKLGVDYYIIEPVDGSEMFNILQDNFPNIKLTLQDTQHLTKLKKDVDILLAEDNLINQKVAKTIFKNLGYEIEIAENGVQVLEKIQKKDYDIIFMDVMMPEKDGWEATQEIRKRKLDIPVVAITADVSEEARKKAFEVGMNDYIPKPVKIDEIKRVLLKWFSESSKRT